MGHIVFGAQACSRFHLHERLHRELRFRGHRVSWLCTDPYAATFGKAQSMTVVHLHRSPPDTASAPIQELAQLECLRRGQPTGGGAQRRIALHFARLLPEALRFFEAWTPDLLLLHGERSGIHRLLHFTARQCGTRVLWTGDGLLPHTMQVDEEGLDGESSVQRRGAIDYRSTRGDDDLLAAASASLLARLAPQPLAHSPLAVPPLAHRLRDAFSALLAGDASMAMAAMRAWRNALPPVPRADPPHADLPRDPFLCVLLQRGDDPRLRLDARTAPGPAELVRSLRNAARQLDPALPIVAVLPEGGVAERELAQLRDMSGVLLELHGAAPDAVAMAVAVATVNHPLGAGSLLLGTPLLHLGQALYELNRVTVRSRTETLTADLHSALRQDNKALRRRFLSWLFTNAHVWCSADAPDHNGIQGLVQVIESRLREGNAKGLPLTYRPGPAWPLAAGSPSP